MERVHRENARVFKALCDPNRLAVLKLLRSGEKCACVLLKELEVTQTGLSYHMKILCQSGIVESRHAGKWTHYRLSAKGSQYAIGLLQQITTPDAVQIENCCLNEE